MRPLFEGGELITYGARTIVEGGRCLRFSPARPEVLPQFATPRALLGSSQNGFYALDLRAEGEEGAEGAVAEGEEAAEGAEAPAEGEAAGDAESSEG